MKRLALILALAGAASAQSFPGSVYTPLVAKDNVSTTLAAQMLIGDNVAIVQSGTGWAANMLAYICDSSTSTTRCTGTFEIMKVTNVNGQALTVTRAQGGTSAVAHAAGRAISNAPVSVYNKALSDEVQAIETALGADLNGANAGPNWASLTTNWADLSRNVGAYPSNAWFGDESTAIPEAIRGSISIPASVTADGAHGAGVAGYCLTASTNKGCVGTFGYAGSTVGGAYVVGGNFLASNTGQPQTLTGGHSELAVVGAEIDVHIVPLAGGAAPTLPVYGLGVIGASPIKPIGAAYAIHLDALGYNQTPKGQWDAAVITEDATAPIGITLGTALEGNGVASQSIQASGRDGGGVTRTGIQLVDSAGDWVVRAGSGAQVLLEDSSGNIGAQVVPSGATPYLLATNMLRTPLGAFGSVTSPNTSIDTNGALSIRPAAVTLANGANQNIDIASSSVVRTAGPTGVFSLGGFANPFDGRWLLVYNNVAFAMTITNEAAGSTATNRIKTLTGADVTLRAGTSAATFYYDGTVARWILMSTN
jgi:hypothetical protein